MILYKNGLIRDVKESRIEEYIAAGWSKAQVNEAPAVVEADEVINLKPPARVKAAAKKADDNAIEEQGE